MFAIRALDAQLVRMRFKGWKRPIGLDIEHHLPFVFAYEKKITDKDHDGVANWNQVIKSVREFAVHERCTNQIEQI